MLRTGWQRIVAGAVTAVAPLAVTLALGTAVLWAAPLAHADPNDEQFLNTLTLHEMGCTQVSFLNCGPSGEQSLIDLGKDICATMRSHQMSEATGAATLMRAVAKEGPDKFPFTDDMATVFVEAAETAYCPDLRAAPTN
jgi:Protein of unknown function (DUF732)